MAVSGRVNSSSITSSVLNTTRSQREASALLAIQHKAGVKAMPPVSQPGTGRGHGAKISGAMNLSGGRF